jgi:hypothetical protein
MNSLYLFSSKGLSPENSFHIPCDGREPKFMPERMLK